jgi:uncharacterized protein
MRLTHLSRSFIVTSFCLIPLLSALTGAATPEQSLAEIEKAANSGDAAAEFQMARAYLRGTGVSKDPAKAFDYMKQAAEQEYPDALGGMGYFYAMGVTVSKDQATAVEWFRKGAGKGSPKAQLDLGLALARGSGVEKNEPEGLRLIDAAAGKGLPDALYAQGETYYWGQFGRAVDYQKAFPLFEKAAQAGNLSAQNNLGMMLREGLGTEKDALSSVDWLRKAATQGHSRAQSNLGHTLGANAPDRATRIEALKWLLLAVDQQEVTAVKTMEELTPNLAADDLRAAHQAADDFRRNQPIR